MLREHHASRIGINEPGRRESLAQVVIDLEKLRPIDEQQMWTVFGLEQV